MEILESRCLMAGNIMATFDNGSLHIEGTPNSDQIVVYRVGNDVRVNDVQIRNSAGRSVNVAAAQLRSVSIDALAGNDLIWLKGNLSLPLALRTGSGTDVLAAGPRTTLTSSDIGPLDLRVNTATGIWSQLEAATRDASGTYTINRLVVPSGLPTIPSVNITNVKLRVNADSLELISGTFALPGINSSVSLRGVINKDGTFTLSSNPTNVRVAGIDLKNFSARVTNSSITYQGFVQHKFLGSNPIAVSGNVESNTGNFSLVANIPNRSMFNGNLTLTKQQVVFNRNGLRFVADATLSSLGVTATFQGVLNGDGKYNLSAGFNGSIAGVSVNADKVFTWDNDNGINIRFAGVIPGMPQSSSTTSAFSFSGSYGPDNWSLTGKYNKPITIGMVTLTDIAVTLNKNRSNNNDFVEVSAVGSFLGWKALANVKGIARFYRDGRFKFTGDGSVIDTAQITSAFGGYRMSQASLVATNMRVTQNSNGEYLINESVKTGIVSAVVKGNIKVGGFELSRFSGTIDSKGYYKFQSMDRVSIPWTGANLARTSIFLEKGKGMTFSSTVDVGVYRFGVNGSMSAGGKLTIIGSNGTANGLSLATSTIRGELDSISKSYSISINGSISTPFGAASLETKLSGKGAVPAATATARVTLSGLITKLFTGAVAITLDNNASRFNGTVAIKGLNISRSISGTFSANGTVSLNGISFRTSDLTDPKTVARVLNAVGITDPANVAQVIWNNVSRSLNDVANALAGIGASRSSIARALATGIGGTNVSIGNAILNIPGTNLDQVAQALRSGIPGINLDAVSNALWNMGGNTRSKIVGAISRGIGSSNAEIAVAIRSIPGTTLSNVANALKFGVSGISMPSISNALWNMGRNTRSDIAGALAAGVGGYYSDMAKAIRSIPGTTLDDVARALQNGIRGFTVDNIANALWFMGGNNFSRIANTLWSVGGNTRSVIAGALANGIGGNYRDMAVAIKSIPGTSVNNVANALKTGIKGIQDNSIANALQSVTGSTAEIRNALSSIGISATAVNSAMGSIGKAVTNAVSKVSKIF